MPWAVTYSRIFAAYFSGSRIIKAVIMRGQRGVGGGEVWEGKGGEGGRGRMKKVGGGKGGEWGGG